MRKIFFGLLLVSFLLPVLMASNAKTDVIQLKDLLKPESMVVDDYQIYITEKEKVFIYSKKDFNLVNQFGKRGEGPAEFKVIPIMGVRISVKPQYILVKSVGRVSYFTLNGTYKSEKVLGEGVSNHLEPIGSEFIMRKLNRDKTKYDTVISLLGADFKNKKEICRFSEPMAKVGDSLLMKHPLARPIKFEVYQNRIYVAGAEGLRLDVYDSQGNFLQSIETEYKPRKVSSREKEAILSAEEMKSKASPFLSRLWPETKKVLKVPDSFPEIRDFNIDDGKIYIATFKIKDSLTECFIYNTEGQLLKKQFLPLVENSFTELFPYSIRNHTIYQLVENEEDDQLELHVTSF